MNSFIRGRHLSFIPNNILQTDLKPESSFHGIKSGIYVKCYALNLSVV